MLYQFFIHFILLQGAPLVETSTLYEMNCPISVSTNYASCREALSVCSFVGERKDVMNHSLSAIMTEIKDKTP